MSEAQLQRTIEDLQQNLDDLESDLGDLAHADAAYKAAEEEYLTKSRFNTMHRGILRAEALGRMQASITIALITAKNVFGWAK